MLTPLRLYREYRRQGLSRAWQLSGMGAIARGAAKGALLTAMLIASVFAITQQAQAIHDAADNRVAARLSNQTGEIQALRQIVAKCLGSREGAIWIGDEMHLCRAVPTGVRK